MPGKKVFLDELRAELAGAIGLDSGLPDGLFSYQKCQLGYILEDLGTENIGVFLSHLLFLLPFW
jgi:hypothetical protein